MIRIALAVAVSLGAALLPAAPAVAGIAGVTSRGPEGVTFIGNPGESNAVVIERNGDKGFTVEDTAAPLEPGLGCTSVSPNRVECPISPRVDVYLGDGNDFFNGPGGSTDVGPFTGTISAFGQQGADFIAPGHAPTVLDGGPGEDVLTADHRTVSVHVAPPVTGFGFTPDRDTVNCISLVGMIDVEADELDVMGEGAPACRVTRVDAPEPPGRVVRGERGKCRRSSTQRGVKRLARSADGVVFTRNGKTHACSYADGQIWKVADPDAGEIAFPVTDGRYLAYASRATQARGEAPRLLVFDIARGRTVYESEAIGIRRIVLKRNGSVAWSGYSAVTAAGYRRVTEIHTVSAVGAEGDVLVERSPSVEATSLKLASNKRAITWVNLGKKRTAPLP